MDVEHLSRKVEQVSQIYAEKFNIERDATWFVLKLQEEVGELIQCYLMLSGKARTKGKSAEEIQSDFNKEVADVFCHTLLLARFYGIDLEKEIERKWLFPFTGKSAGLARSGGESNGDTMPEDDMRRKTQEKNDERATD